MSFSHDGKFCEDFVIAKFLLHLPFNFTFWTDHQSFRSPMCGVHLAFE